MRTHPHLPIAKWNSMGGQAIKMNTLKVSLFLKKTAQSQGCFLATQKPDSMPFFASGKQKERISSNQPFGHNLSSTQIK